MNKITKSSLYEQFKITSFIIAAICLSIGIIHIFYGTTLNAIVNIVLATALVLNYTINYKFGNKKKVFLAIGLVFYLFELYTGGFHNLGWLWSLTVSPITFLLVKRNYALKINIVYGFTLFLVFLLQFFTSFQTAHLDGAIFTLIIIYSLNTYLLSKFQDKIDYYNSKLSRNNIELKNKISLELEANENKNKTLRLQSKQAQMGEMVSMIAHQWRQPLNAISASAIKLKLENDLGVITSQSIDKSSLFIQERTQDMSEIINNFLDYSKSTSKSMEFSIINVIDKTIDVISNQFAVRGIFLTLNYQNDTKNIKVNGVENLLEQVLLNLLFNSRDAFDELKNVSIKNIYISLDEDGSISIEDNAGGIAQDIIEKLFNPYFTTKEEGKGTGLGLYMSRKIMKDNFNGNLVHKALENGSLFTIKFGNIKDKSSAKEKDAN